MHTKTYAKQDRYDNDDNDMHKSLLDLPLWQHQKEIEGEL